MPLLYHGFAKHTEGAGGCLHFGFLRFLRRIAEAYWWGPRLPHMPPPPNWRNSWFDNRFNQGVKKLEDCLFKIIRCAERIDECGPALAAGPAAMAKMEPLAAFQRADRDVSIDLDSILSYLKITADCLADAVPNVYGRAGQSICRRNFGGMRAWFSKHGGAPYPEFRKILQARTGWFGLLSGIEGRPGLRTVITHDRGIYRLIIAGGGTNIDAVQPVLVGDENVISGNVIQDLSHSMRGLCEFLDASLLYVPGEVNRQVDPTYPVEHRLAPGATTFCDFATFRAEWLFPRLG